MSTRAQITIAVGGVLTGGLVLAKVPPEVLVPVLGASSLPVLGTAAAYASSARFRRYVGDAAEELDRLLNAPRARRRLAAPDDPRALLEGLLAQQMAAPAPQAQTARLVRRAPAETRHPLVQALPEPEYVPLPPGPRIVISYHPELGAAWAEHAQTAGLADAPRLAGDLDTAAATLVAELGATQVRVAAAGGGERGPALALVVTNAPPTPAQEAALDSWGTWWQPYTSGRLQGVLVLLASPQAAAATRRVVVTPPVEPAGYGRQSDYQYSYPATAEPAPELPLVEFATRLGQREALPPPPPRPRMPARPLAPPMARLEGDGAIKTVMVAVGTLAGQWHYVPMKHGLIANVAGGGKSNLLDLISGQLQGLGDAVDVWYGTAKPFVMITPEDRLDRRPLIAYLPEAQVARSHEEILTWMWRAWKRVEENYRAMQANPGWFPRPMAIIFDEAKAYFEMVDGEKVDLGNGKTKDMAKFVSGLLKQLIILARECGGSVVFTSQDGYCGSLRLTRGEIGNLGFRMVHPRLDANSMGNVLPEGAPSTFAAGPWQWWCASQDRVELVDIPRVSAAMFRAWGLLADAPPPAAGVDSSDPAAPALDDATLLRWVITRSRAGEAVTVERAAAEFGVTVEAMRAQMVVNGLLEG